MGEEVHPDDCKGGFRVEYTSSTNETYFHFLDGQIQLGQGNQWVRGKLLEYRSSKSGVILRTDNDVEWGRLKMLYGNRRNPPSCSSDVNVNWCFCRLPRRTYLGTLQIKLFIMCWRPQINNSRRKSTQVEQKGSSRSISLIPRPNMRTKLQPRKWKVYHKYIDSRTGAHPKSILTAIADILVLLEAYMVGMIKSKMYGYLIYRNEVYSKNS